MSGADLKRRNTVVEEAEATLIQEATNSNTKLKQKKSLKERLSDIGSQIYNAEYREFLERDSKAWFKLALFYFIFYLLLAGFFIFQGKCIIHKIIFTRFYLCYVVILL